MRSPPPKGASLRRRTVLLTAAIGCFALGVLAAWLFLSRDPAPGAREGSVEDFRLLDHLGFSHLLPAGAGAPLVVLVSHGADCPIAQRGWPILRALRDRYRGRAAFFLIDASPQDDPAALARHVKGFGIDMPVLLDPSQVVSESLGLRRTAEALLIDAGTRRVLYRGAVTDRLDYGVQKPGQGRGFLEEALQARLEGRQVAVPRTEAKGCLIRMAEPRPLTYTADAAPILRARCLACHSGGGGALSLDGYEKVRDWAPMIRETLRTGRMPPWQADPAYGPRLSNDATLTPAELGTLVRWVEAGAPRGAGPEPLPGPPPPRRDVPDGPADLTLAPGGPTELRSRTTGPVWRYAGLRPPTERDLWLRGVRFVPGNPGIISHLRLVALPESPEAFKARWGAVEPYGIYEKHVVMNWNPGMAARLLPEHVGVLIPKGSWLLLGMHYKPHGRDETDWSKVELFLHRSRPKVRRRLVYVENPRFSIPPGAPDVEVSAERTFPRGAVLAAIGPHMHNRGSWVRCTAYEPGGAARPLLSLPAYDRDWPRVYVFEQPVRLPPGTRVVLQGSFDNSGRNPRNPDPSRRVLSGPDANDDEMFLAALSLLEPADAP